MGLQSCLGFLSLCGLCAIDGVSPIRAGPCLCQDGGERRQAVSGVGCEREREPGALVPVPGSRSAGRGPCTPHDNEHSVLHPLTNLRPTPAAVPHTR
ncbi:hypothetical protein AAFF_G00190240 [Aldrovandia affinis]|uniref:Secreted protein n=1 Tax=Aldrovandia affinis TaxID=143900 RepID=A0AAD7RJH5_9TELE|nr:hypothetical protein AAFF_G00190240 [Aldrovandia affinis]